MAEDLPADLRAVIEARSRGRIDALAWDISPDATQAAVLLVVRDSGYWLESLYRRVNGLWEENTTSNGSRTYSDGVYRFYGEAPAGASTAVVEYRDQSYEVPVTSEHYAFAIWDLADSEFDSIDEPWIIQFLDEQGGPLGHS